MVTWGHAMHGGDSSAVHEELVEVVAVQATSYAFAAISRGWGVGWDGFEFFLLFLINVVFFSCFVCSNLYVCLKLFCSKVILSLGFLPSALDWF